MSKKLLASVGTAAIAISSLLAIGAQPAYAAAGCAANNASTESTVTASIDYPPGSVTVDSSSVHCAYVSNGGLVHWRCDLVGGRCTFKFGTSEFGCITLRGFCVGSFNVAPGTVIDVTVYGGSASAADAA